MDAGLNIAVKDNDSQFPPEWRLSRSGRARSDRRDGLSRAPPPLTGLRVVDLSTWIAGAYCTKLLADGGAEVIKVEAPEGDPLRRWSASGAAIAAGDDGALFNFLAASKRSVVVEPARAEPTWHAARAARIRPTPSSGRAGPPVAEHPAARPRELLRAHPHLIVTSITPFGLDGPWSDKPATEFTLQAWSGGDRRARPRDARPGAGLRRRPDRRVARRGRTPPSARWPRCDAAPDRRRARRRVDARGPGDVPHLLPGDVQRPARPTRCASKRFVPTPGRRAATDGLVGLGCGTGQQWLDFCVMVGHPEWMEDPSLFLDRTALAPTIDAWVAEHTVEEVLDLASAFRIPNAPIANGANATTFEHFRQRGTFVANPTDGAANPRPPFRLSSAHAATRRAGAAPRRALRSTTSGERRAHAGRHRRPTASALPFEGLRVLDMTAFWAGPLAGHVLALLGAEVIHLESATRPDGARLVGGVPQTRGPVLGARPDLRRAQHQQEEPDDRPRATSAASIWCARLVGDV